MSWVSSVGSVGLALLILGCASLEGARLYARGSEALDRGDFQAAIADLEQAASLVPQASEVHNHLGIAYSQAGREAEAVRAFERALALDCNNQAARRNLLAVQEGGGGP